MISGINNLYGSQSVYNQYKINQLFQNKYSSSAVSPVSKIPSLDTTSSSVAQSLSFLKSYSSSMTDLMTSANALKSSNSASAVNKLSAFSSDTSVLEANSRYSYSALSEASYEVDVSQLAKSQVNTSEALSSTAKATSDIDMKLVTNDKDVSIHVSSTNANGSLKSNSQMLADAAKQINSSNSGLKASVITKDGTSSLQIESKATGTGSSFVVSGSFSEDGKGGMSNVTQSAQNAEYTYTENGVTKSGVSESNKISLGYGAIEATLKSEGTASITVGKDPAKLVSSLESLVDSYNSAVTLLSKNTDRGRGTAEQLSRMQRSITGTKEHMEKLGLSINKDGTLALDKQTLTENLKKDPKLTADLITGSYGIGQKAYSSAQNALNTPTSSLISNDIATAQYQQAADPITSMSYYSRSGAYTMMNYYAVGMMFNTMV